MIAARNANTFDFVLPTTGDPTAFDLSPDISPGGVPRRSTWSTVLDIVRIFVDIPEQDANFVHIGTKATVLAKAYRDEPISGHRHAHLLGAEHEEPHAPRRDRPAQPRAASSARDVRLRQGDHRAPGRAGAAARRLDYSGDKTFCWLYENGKAVRTEVETGVSDGEWIEVTNRRPPVHPEAPGDSVPWTPIDGTEQVILGDLSSLADGAPVEVAPATAGTKLASDAPAADRAAPAGSADIEPGRRPMESQ